MNLNKILKIQSYDHYKDNKGDLLNFLIRFIPDIDILKWEWEYCTLKNKSTIIVAKLNNNFIGHYACLNYKFLYFSNILYGGKTEGSYIDFKRILKSNKNKSLDINNRKIFEILIEKLLNKTNNEILFGFPNKIALIKQINCGYKLMEIDIVKYYFLNNLNKKYKNITFVFLLLVKIFSNLYLKIKLFKYNIRRENIVKLKKIHKNKLLKFLNTYKEKNKNLITIYRDWDFLNWRFKLNPYSKNEIFIVLNKKKEIIGLMALGIPNNNLKTLQIQDIITLNFNATTRLIKFSLYFMKINNFEKIEIWSGKNKNYNMLNKALFKNGFIIKRKFKKNMIIRSNILEYKKLFNKNYWYITMAFLRY